MSPDWERESAPVFIMEGPSSGLEEDQVKAPGKHRSRLAKAQKPRTPLTGPPAIAEALKSSTASMPAPVWKG